MSYYEKKLILKGEFKMETMNNETMENTVTEVLEEATKKVTFGENLLAYTVAGVFAVGVATTGYLGYKGIKGIVNKIKTKKETEVDSEDDVVDVEHVDIHEVKDDETEE